MIWEPDGDFRALSLTVACWRAASREGLGGAGGEGEWIYPRKTLGIDRKMTELASSIQKQCLLPQTTAGIAGNRPRPRGTFFVWLAEPQCLDP